jgi:hypothetical protein
VARRLRKHRAALIALAVYHFVLFFPTAFMGRVLSPNDIFYNYYPWSTVRPAEVVQAQNSALNDPASTYLPGFNMLRHHPEVLNWNPFIASGNTGLGSAAGALSPFLLAPLLFPELWMYTVMVLLKLNVPFFFSYLWLREERMGKRAAALGAIVVAAAGIYSIRWLWHSTSATALFPAMLWIVRRRLNGKNNSIAIVTLIALSYAVAGFPSAMAYGAWTVLLYAIAGGALRPSRLRGFARDGAGVALAFLIALPTLIPFVRFVNRSGYLAMRESASVAGVFPPEHWRSFLNPDRLGHHVYKDWIGDPRLLALNNYPETTIYLGLLTLPLILLGMFNRRARARWLWLVFSAIVVACMFGAPVISTFIGNLPGFKYSALARVVLLLPLGAGYLAAAGSRLLRKRLLMYAAILVISFDLALLAGRFYPFLEPHVAQVPVTPTMKFLRAEQRPFRMAPFFDYFWPNASELVRVEDVRSHFSSDLQYRQMLLRIDPTAWSGRSTIITFNSIEFNFADPLTGLLGIRWYLEHNIIDIIKWKIFSNTVPGVKEISGWVPIDGVLQRTVHVDAEPFWSIELPVRLDEAGAKARLDVALIKNGAVVWSRAFAKNDITALGKIYIPLRPHARLGERATLRLQATNMRAFVLEGENPNPAEARIFYGRVTIPIIFDRELPDGRLFRNLSELPRFRAVSRLRKLNDEEFLAARDVDFEKEAVITDDPIMPPPLGPANARVTLTRYGIDEQHLSTSSDAPFLLASSEKLTPDLRVTIDGRAARTIETDSIFTGVEVPAGNHEIRFTRRIGRGWWWATILGGVLWVVVAVRELVRRRG